MDGGACSPCGCKESDRTEQLHFHFQIPSDVGKDIHNWVQKMGQHIVTLLLLFPVPTCCLFPCIFVLTKSFFWCGPFIPTPHIHLSKCFFFPPIFVLNATFKHSFLVSLKQLLSLPFTFADHFPFPSLSVEIVFYWIEYRISALSQFVMSGTHINLSLSQLPHLSNRDKTSCFLHSYGAIAWYHRGNTSST